jgi:hypothetical protein
MFSTSIIDNPPQCLFASEDDLPCTITRYAVKVIERIVSGKRVIATATVHIIVRRQIVIMPQTDVPMSRPVQDGVRYGIPRFVETHTKFIHLPFLQLPYPIVSGTAFCTNTRILGIQWSRVVVIADPARTAWPQSSPDHSHPYPPPKVNAMQRQENYQTRSFRYS